VVIAPGGRLAGLVFRPPLTGSLPPNDIEFEDRTPSADDPPLNADIQVVSVGYFEAMEIPLLIGRQFDRTDDASTEAVAIVDEPFARRFFSDPGQAIGARVRQFGRPEFARVVGVVGAVRQGQLSSEPRAQLYLLHEQSERTWGTPLRSMSVMARTDVAPSEIVEALRGEVRALDPNLPVFAETTVEETLRGATASERFNLFLQLVFAGVALLLAAIGIYGVLSYQVQQRTREIGIRLALGAERDRIVGMVVRQAMALVILAVAMGLLGAMLAGGLLSSLLYQVSARDPVTYAAVTGVLLAVALLACWLPARRASGIDPQSALRSE
jgi:putative ABC transport system permease protein